MAGIRGRTDVVVRFNRFPELSRGMEAKAEVATAKAAHDMEAGVKAGIQGFGLIDTGAMFNSVQARQIGPARWVVEVGQSYAIYHVFGTRHLPARDFWHPTIARVAASFTAAMSTLVPG